ncbi:c-type cytochrome [Albidovulum sediminicola]|uniref:Cytochrome c family protein n=1 Tax=Albidovulum sediminicola TaxID=2984331 RepID=A0ABT2YX41_9RHOB|nr:cytochrome c family protein [Defluviimonas sp. WL0075]MCV2863441.1 cytochrome c family protein [Defluviimonas sp. WL0075]
MFDTMTVTKAGGALCGALLIFLLGNWAAESLYHTGAESHGDEEVAQAYTIDTGASEGGEAAAAEEGPSFDELFAAADAGAGEKVFGKCKACHKTDGSNGTGPHLDGVVDRAVGSVAGFSYSDAMGSHGGTWAPAELDAFLANPKGAVPGTKMSFAGLPKAEDRVNLIAYLQSLGG